MKLSNEEARELIQIIDTSNMKPFIIPNDILIISAVDKPIKLITEGQYQIYESNQDEAKIMISITDLIENNIGYWAMNDGGK